MRQTDFPEMLARVYRAGDADTLQRCYDEWARDYDRDFVQGLGWTAPEEAAEQLRRHLPAGDTPILDIGAGTGLVGVALAGRGYTNVEALDLSAAMLEVCLERGVYRAFHRAQLGLPLPLPSNHYAAVIAVGVFTEGHAGPDCFEELTRVLRPGAFLVFALRPDVREAYGFSKAQEAFTASGKWELIEVYTEVSGFRDIEGVPYPIWVYQIR